MDIREFLEMLINLILLPAIYYGLKLAKDYVVAQIESKKLQEAIEMADIAVRSAVAETAQSFVDDMKKADSFGADEAKQAALMALQSSRSILGGATIDILRKGMGDVNAYLTARIEEEVRKDNYFS